MTEPETHPMPEGYVPAGSKTLVVGTFPPKDLYINSESFFFYPSPRNHFWNRVEDIFPDLYPKLKKTQTRLIAVSPAQNKKDKENFAARRKIGFIDVFTTIRRRAESTKDVDIISVEDIVDNGRLMKILESTPTIDRICCTYSLAYNTLKNKLGNDRLTRHDDPVSANKEKLVLDLNRRKVEIFLLYPATRSGHKREVKDSQYKKLLFRSTGDRCFRVAAMLGKIPAMPGLCQTAF